MLQLVIGSSGISLGILLGTFMGGLCLGSILARRISPNCHPLRVYAVLEIGIGGCGLGLLWLLPFAAKIYVFWGSGLPGFLGRGLLCSIMLLPPTILMGATLPAIARQLDSTRSGIASLALLYMGNIVGGVIGCLVGGFYLLRVHNMAVTSYTAVVLNLWVAMTALYLSGATQATKPEPKPALTTPLARRASAVYFVIALSGFCSLSAEVVWTRLLSLVLGATVYAFSIILAVFLGGLALGSSAGAALARTNNRPGLALGACQVGLALAIGWAALVLGHSLPYWPIQPSLSHSIWLSLQLDVLRCAWAIFPATVLFGASFPLALAAATSKREDQARFVGRLYATNTVGAVFGAILSSLILLPWLGSQNLQRLLIGTAAGSGLLMLAGRRVGYGPAGLEEVRTSTPGNHWTMTVAAAIAAVAIICSVPRLPWGLVAYGRYLPGKTDLGNLLYVGEGINASVAVTELSSGVRNFHVSGKIEASTDPRDMRLQRMLGHIPALLHPHPRSVLVVGCGAGVTAGSFVPYPQIEELITCEIEPLIPRVVAQYFGQENNDFLRDPRCRLVYDDARHFVLTTREKFDIITSDPIHPWVKGAATLYTREYFEICRAHLNPGGLVTQWVPLYESNLAVVRSEIATFFDVFPNSTIWSNDDNGEGYDIVLLGSVDPVTIDLQKVQARLARQDFEPVLQSLRDVGFKSSYSLFATYAGQVADLKPWLRPAQINRDRDLRLQYLAGLGLNFNEQDLIFSDLLVYRRFPEELFTGSNVWKATLKSAIEKSSAKK